MVNNFNDLNYRDLKILNLIQKRGPITKKDLQLITDTKLTTLNRVMKTLEDRKIIMEHGESESTGGRKAVEYDISKTGFYVIGLDISRTYVKVVLTTLKLCILKKAEFQMDESYSPEKTVEIIGNIIDEMLIDLSIAKDEILGVGIGTVGPLDREAGIIINPKGFFNDNWANVPLKALLEQKLSIPCLLDNGANTAVLAEYLYGLGRDLKSIVYIHCGMGIRSAMITDGNLIRMINDSEDAFGHMIVAYGGEKCSCGNGCIESYSTLDSIIKKINITEEDKGKLVNEMNYKETLKAELWKGDTSAINKGAEILGIGLANLVRLINPQLIILSGPLIMNVSNYYEKSIESYHDNNHMFNKVIFSKGGNFQEEVIALGAAAMILETYLKNI